MACIYKIVNLINGHLYIGSTSRSLKKRKVDHLYHLRRNSHHCAHLQNAWNKYGEESFSFEIVEDLLFPSDSSKDYINEYLINQEIYYITSLEAEYNTCREINRGRLGREKSLEEIQKWRDSRGETKEETRRRIREARSKQTITSEHKQAISRALKGRCTKPGGWKHSSETIAKMVSSTLASKKANPKRPFEVYTSDGKTLLYQFDLLPEAEVALNMDRRIIWRVLNNSKSHITRGYFFKYKEKI